MENTYREEINKNEVIIYDKHVVFWGSPFSNFFPCDFVIDDVHWKTSEQYFMAMKAMTFNDTETYEKILKAEHPRDAKKLGREVKGYDDAVWSGVREQFMHDAVYAKFSQNEDLKNFLFDEEFEGKGFVEGSPFDGVWGVKMDWRNPMVDDEANWNGLNLLGKTLDKVREELR